MPTEEQIATAVKTILNSALSSYGSVVGGVKALDYDEAVSVTREHVQMSLAPRFTAVARAGRQAQQPWRLTTRPVGDTVTNSRTIEDRVTSALKGLVLTVAGVRSTPVWFETADELNPDDGKYDRLTTWTFVL